MIYALEIFPEESDSSFYLVASKYWTLGHRCNCAFRTPSEGIENPHDVVAIFILVSLFDSKRLQDKEWQ